MTRRRAHFAYGFAAGICFDAALQWAAARLGDHLHNRYLRRTA